MNVNKALFSFIKIAFSIMIVLLVVYGTVRLCSTAYGYGYRLYTEPAVDEEPGSDVLVQVKSDMTGRKIAEMLGDKGLVRDSGLFYVQLVLYGYSDQIRPGVYTLNTSMGPKELMIAMSPESETEEETEGGEETLDGTELTDLKAGAKG